MAAKLDSSVPAPKPEYTSFLLRLWREPQPDAEGRTANAEWLVQTEHIPSGDQRYFASLEECFAYIRAQAETATRDGSE